MLEIGPCDYKDELTAVSTGQPLNADAPLPQLAAEKAASQKMLQNFLAAPGAAGPGLGPSFSVARAHAAALKAAAATEAAWTLAGDPGRSS